MSDYFVRPMTVDDVPAVERLTDQAFFDLDLRTRRAGWPAPERRSAEAATSWRLRLNHVVGTDPGGCWVAEDADGLLGAAASRRRDTTWMLSTLAVRTGLQGRGVGRQILDAALAYGAGCLYGMLASSEDPLAVRRYRLAGFTLHPTMLMWGDVPRAALPVVERVRDGSGGDIDLISSVDRQVRGAALGRDHELLTDLYRLVVADRPSGSGYAYVDWAGGCYLLVATNRRTATDLLWECLAASVPGKPAMAGQVTAANEWAIDVAMACRLELWTHGYLALRGRKPPSPYLPSGFFL